MFKKTLEVLALSSALIALPSFAEQGDISIGVGGSLTQGIGIEAGYDIADNLTLRGLYYTASFNEDETIDGIEYDVDFDLENSGFFLDYRPFSNDSHGFRLTAGLISNGNSLSAIGSPTAGTYDIAGTTYTAAQVGTLKANLEFDNIAPYLGTGYDIGFTDNLSLNLEAGVIFHGSPDVKLSADGLLASDPTFQSDLDAEQSSAQDDVDDFKYMPVVKVSLMYRF